MKEDKRAFIAKHKQIISAQKEICRKYDVEWDPSPPDLKVGVSENVKKGLMPINGLRHSAEKETAGWFIWAGEYSEDPNYFKPMHVEHLDEYSPLVLKYLGLPPGWRFQIDDRGYEDVWFDEKLLSDS